VLKKVKSTPPAAAMAASYRAHSSERSSASPSSWCTFWKGDKGKRSSMRRSRSSGERRRSEHARHKTP